MRGVRIGLYVSGAGGTHAERLLARFARAEDEGFASVWVGQVFQHDALTLLAAAATVTRRIELGTWVVPVQTRHPLVLAQQAATVQALCSGRLVLGIGASHAEVIESRLGLAPWRPLRDVRETLELLVPLLRDGRVERDGESGRLRATLELRVPPPPVLVGALGPQMLALAGARADGAAIWLGGPRFLAWAAPRVREAAAAAGRPPPRIACGLPIALVRDAARARASAAALLASSAGLPAYRRVLEREGVARAADVALLGGEVELGEALDRLEALGASDFNAVLFAVEGEPDALPATREFLARRSRSAPATAPPR
jgi:F420-dependent oxidoreductase-like protein